MTWAHVVQHADTLALSGVALVLTVATLLGALVLAWCYARGLRRLRRHAQGRRLHRWRPVALVTGVAAGLLVTLPPLGGLAEARLSTHMGQHMVLVLVAAPLLALAAPGQALLAGAPRPARERVVRALHRLPLGVPAAPLLAWVLHVGALWVWHLPGAYDAALRFEAVHVLEHATFLVTAWLFWWHVATLSARRLRGPVAALYVASVILPGSALGAVLTFAGEPVYPAQAAATAAVGGDPLLDQRIGGLVMWLPMDLGYILVAVLLFSRWFTRIHQDGVAPAGPADAGAAGALRSRTGVGA